MTPSTEGAGASARLESPPETPFAPISASAECTPSAFAPLEFAPSPPPSPPPPPPSGTCTTFAAAFFLRPKESVRPPSLAPDAMARVAVDERARPPSLAPALTPLAPALTPLAPTVTAVAVLARRRLPSLPWGGCPLPGSTAAKVPSGGASNDGASNDGASNDGASNDGASSNCACDGGSSTLVSSR